MKDAEAHTQYGLKRSGPYFVRASAKTVKASVTMERIEI